MGKLNGQRYHFLYKSTNLINGKFYVGIHSTYNLKDGYLGSGKRLKRAVKKYGEENFKCEILEFFESREEVLLREKEIVNEQLINDPLCMNLKPGGNGGWTKEQQSKNGKNGNEKIKWLKENDLEWVKNLKKSRSEGHKLSYKNGRKPVTVNWTSKKHKEETKRKIGVANSINQMGKNNSQYGTCWINNGKEVKKIKKEELQFWLNKNWIQGRKSG